MKQRDAWLLQFTFRKRTMLCTSRLKYGLRLPRVIGIRLNGKIAPIKGETKPICANLKFAKILYRQSHKAAAFALCLYVPGTVCMFGDCPFEGVLLGIRLQKIDEKGLCL